ncbi:MAG: EAL domain-containing protein [Alphaproteobacteria bacterium]
MAGPSAKHFNLPWHNYDYYWIAVFSADSACADALRGAGMQQQEAGFLAVRAGSDWKPKWDEVYAILKDSAARNVQVAVTPGSETLPADMTDRKSPEDVHKVAESLWLGDAIQQDRVVCYLQPVVSARDKVFGYESFARVKAENGEVIGGGKIVAASRSMNIEYMIDRLLHVQAIRTFAASDFNGFLFVNFFPGFIHRPAVYLEGLTDTVKQHGIVARNIVLDFTRSENMRDMNHLKSVCEYCRSKGYSIALDDIASIDGLQKLMAEVRPDFVKIDMHLAHQVADPNKRVLISDIVEMVHEAGGTVIAEGVETEDMYKQLAQLNVDLFQGYHFSAPIPVEEVLKKSATG